MTIYREVKSNITNRPEIVNLFIEGYIPYVFLTKWTS